MKTIFLSYIISSPEAYCLNYTILYAKVNHKSPVNQKKTEKFFKGAFPRVGWARVSTFAASSLSTQTDMLYSILKELHAYNRYFILLALVFVLFRAYSGWLSNRRFEKPDNIGAAALLGLCHLQLLVGLLLFWLSPYGMSAMSNGAASQPGSWARYFSMEHLGAMIVAIALVQTGRIVSKKANDDVKKHRTLAIYVTIATLLIIGTLAHKGLVLGRLADAAIGQ